MVRYHGVLSSHAKLRSEVVPKVDDEGPKQLALFEQDRTVLAPEPRRKPWAWLLRHVFEIDVSSCPRCGGATRGPPAPSSVHHSRRRSSRIAVRIPQVLTLGRSWAGQDDAAPAVDVDRELAA